MKEVFIDQYSLEEIYSVIDSEYNETKFEITFFFKSDFTNAKMLRDSLVYIFDKLGCDPIWKNRFVLIVDELNNNSIEYGSKYGSTNALCFSSELHDNQIYLTIEVRDCGDGESPKTAHEMEALRMQRVETGFSQHKSIRGRGLFLIITKLVDVLYFQDANPQGLIVGVQKKLEKHN